MGGRGDSNHEAAEITYFDQYYAKQPYSPAGWRLRLRRELRRLLRQAGGRRLGRVLSVGCGEGRFEMMLAPYAESVTGIDISPEAVAGAKAAADELGVRNVEFQCRPSAEIDWAGSYDAIVCLSFLHHLATADVPAFLGRVHDHLAPGGLFYSEDPNRRGFLRKVGRVVMGAKYDRYHSPDERELDPREVASLLSGAGFSEVKIGYIDVTLIPASYLLRRAPGWLFYGCAGFDYAWCHSPLARYASGFTAFARKQTPGGEHA